MNEKNRAFVRAMAEAVEERGREWTYPVEGEAWRTDAGLCRYVRADVAEPGCLIGFALHRAGESLDTLRTQEGEGAVVILRKLGYSRQVAEAAGWAQGRQDMGDTWGRSHDAFLRVLTEID